MASLTIRKLNDSAKAKLRVRAAEHGRSMEEEARLILEGAVQVQLPQAAREKPRSFYQSIRRHLAEAGIDGIELEIPPRGPMRETHDFSGPEFGANNDE
jgi:plasmid stability protein